MMTFNVIHRATKCSVCRRSGRLAPTRKPLHYYSNAIYTTIASCLWVGSGRPDLLLFAIFVPTVCYSAIVYIANNY